MKVRFGDLLRVAWRWSVLAVAIGISKPTIAQQAPEPNATLTEAIAAWKLTRSETKRVHLKTHGTATILKGFEVIDNPDGTQKAVPSKDIQYETKDEFVIDFKNGKYRHDQRTFTLNISSEKLNPIVRIDILDAIERKIYSANPNRAVGHLVPDVSVKAKNVRDCDVIMAGLEPTMFCFGYLSTEADDGKGWDRDPRPQDLVVVNSSPLRVRRKTVSPTVDLELTFRNDLRFCITQMRWIQNGMTIWDLHVEYNDDTRCPSSWKMTTYGGERVMLTQTHYVDECRINAAIPPDAFGIQLKPGMAVKTDDGFNRVLSDGQLLVPISPIEVARDPKD